MSAAKHTPGPWELGEDDHNGQAIVRAPFIEIATCWHHCVGSIEKEMRANAQLIAAAPDMKEALETTAENIRSQQAAHPGVTVWDSWLRVVEAALAKARGE